MSFIVFLHIVFHVDEPRDLTSLSQVCRAANRACKHLLSLKKYHFQRISVSWDGRVFNPTADEHIYTKYLNELFGRKTKTIHLSVRVIDWLRRKHRIENTKFVYIEDSNGCY